MGLFCSIPSVHTVSEFNCCLGVLSESSVASSPTLCLDWWDCILSLFLSFGLVFADWIRGLWFWSSRLCLSACLYNGGCHIYLVNLTFFHAVTTALFLASPLASCHSDRSFLTIPMNVFTDVFASVPCVCVGSLWTWSTFLQFSTSMISSIAF